MIPVELNHLIAVDFVLPGNLRPLPTQARSSPICQVWDTQSNDDGQADDNSDDSGGVNVALSERCICPTDWRLIQPDAQFANHFIHAKTKPPP
ncbi:MAG TPA: hypothetical protein VKA67_05615 [Verrucomicrobiae bacterium]|nr:hypothetical protein [Verrucomicrobiae bacterium]